MRRLIALAALVAGPSGCGWFEDLRPVDAHVSVDGTPGARVQLITSSRFVAAVTETGVTQVSVISADTFYPALPFDETYRISGDRRFLAHLSRLDEDLDDVRMRIFVNDDVKFDERGVLVADSPYIFVYTFNQATTRTIDVLF